MARIIATYTAPLFYFFVFFFPLLSHQTMSQPEHMFTFCNTTDNFLQTSSYETNRDTLLSSLRESSTLRTYSNATIGVSPDTVHGMFLCRGDITATSCADCVQTATIEIATNCILNKRAVIYYDECMVRYSDVSFFSELEITPGAVLYSRLSAPNSNRFNQTLSDKFNQLILNVSSSSSIPYFVEDQERVTQPEGSYELESMVQCSPDLDTLNCTVCLTIAFLRVSTCCGSPSVAHIFTPKCLLRYETSVLPSPPLSPSSPPPLSLPPQASPSQSSPPQALPPQSSPPEASPPHSSPPQASPPQSSPPEASPSQSSPPPSFLQTPQSAPPPLPFTRPQNVPSPSGSFSFNVLKGNEIFGRIIVTMTALVFALVDL